MTAGLPRAAWISVVTSVTVPRTRRTRIRTVSPLTLSGVMYLAPPEVCGTALTLRMTGNRVGQIVFPALAGVLAAATGVAGILLALGVGLAATGITVALSQPPPPTT